MADIGSTSANGKAIKGDPEHPPPFDPAHVITLSSPTDSKITNVNLYSGRAEITRLYKFDVRMGMNNVCVTDLPNVLDHQSLRVEGRGAATIHDVTISNTPAPVTVTSSDKLVALQSKKERTQKGLERNKKALEALTKYLNSLNLEQVKANQVGELLSTYNAEAEKLDESIFNIQKEINKIDEEITAERATFTGPERNKKLGKQAAVGVFADSAGAVEIVLIYAVHGASWGALYDIRVDMNATETPVTLVYKAAITQNTGESWEDVPLTLETASPTFGVGLPTLNAWRLSVYKPPQPQLKSRKRLSMRIGSALHAAEASRSAALEEEDDDEDMGFGLFDDGVPCIPAMASLVASVGGGGNVSATFRVPGVISIPSDNEAHNVTIAKLSLDAKMSWICVPKEDTRVHLTAKVKNASEYTLLPGSASVYVDGSFISRSDVPPVSPQESFDCPLGIDSSIRVTYHPRSKKISQSGLLTKNSVHVYSQRTTIHNTKSHPIEGVKLVDQFPVSENSNINVKHVAPALTLPGSSTLAVPSGGNKDKEKPPAPVKVSEGVVAQWDGADEAGVDVSGLGKEGKFNWVCTVPAQEKVNLVQTWEVSAPASTNVVGL